MSGFDVNDVALLTVAEAAQVAGVAPGTVRTWMHRADRGLITDGSGRTLPLRHGVDNVGRVVVSESDVLHIERATRLARRGRRRAI